MRITPFVTWGFVCLFIAFYEGLQLGTHGTPATTVLRTMRFDAFGRFIVVPLFHWLLWHVVYRPKNAPAPTRLDLIPLAIGVAVACITGPVYPLGGIDP